MEAGKFPSGWVGMKNASVQERNGSKWLMMDQPGYWFPCQYNQEIKDSFPLSVNLEWPETVPYYGGLFTVTFGEIKYDNAAEDYSMNEN